ncbi:uncharacterized protein LODBEIA_P15920 [Lodderomyces beijingensis]|uniref:Uncharacterized protein n=1 Tax=Lodderomyces beijingensis TaxID=1775926 RepID=A0ABP0ZIB6_9ASCO
MGPANNNASDNEQQASPRSPTPPALPPQAPPPKKSLSARSLQSLYPFQPINQANPAIQPLRPLASVHSPSLSQASSIPQVRPSMERDRSTTLSSLDIPFHSVEREHSQRDKIKQQRNGDSHDSGSKNSYFNLQKQRPEMMRERSATFPEIFHLESMKASRTSTTATPTATSPSSLKSVTLSHPESPTWLLSDLLSNLSSLKDKDEHYIVQISNDLVHLFQTYAHLEEEVQITTVLPRIQFMLYHPVSEVRSACYRILRHLITSYQNLILLVQSKILIFIIMSLANDQSRYNLVEMEQALKLIRKFLTIDKGANLLSVGVIKSLIAVVESNDIDDHRSSAIVANYGVAVEPISEGFRHACLETLCEIALVKPELIFHAGGFKLIITSLIEDPFEISSSCLLIILRLLNFENSRKFLRNGFDLDSLIAVFSTDEPDTSESLESFNNKFKKISNYKLQRVAFLISSLLKDFNGLMAFSIHDFTSIRNLMLNLTKKNSRAQNFILDILLDCLRFQVFPWLQSSPIGDFLTRFNDLKRSQSVRTQGSNWKKHERRNFPFEYDEIKDHFTAGIVRHYTGLLTYVLIKNGIFESLLTIINGPESPNDLKKKSTLLLTKLYTAANNLLPYESITCEMRLPNVSTQVSFEVVRMTRSKADANTEFNSYVKSKISDIYVQSNSHVNDDEFKAMITNSRVLAIKEYEEWNWTLLIDIIQGPLNNPRRLEEVLERSPKFLKRLMSFFRPFKYRFANTSKKAKNFQKYLTAGCSLLEMLLTSNVGLKYLANSKMMPQLSEIVAQIDPYSGISSNDPILGARRFESAASLGYVKFIGVLSNTSEGLELLTSWQIFTLIFNIISATNKPESSNKIFVLSLFKNVNFTMSDSPFRGLLKMCFSVSSYKIKIHLLKNLIPSLFARKDCELLCIEILVENLYDSHSDIVLRSIEQLYEHYKANDFNNIEPLLTRRPAVAILSNYQVGRKFLVHFLTNPEGFAYLLEDGFLEDEFNRFTHIENFSFTRKIDQLIRQQFYPYVNTSAIEVQTCESGIESSSLYFFKCLLSTEEGLIFFQDGSGKAFLDHLISTIEIIFNQINKDDEFLDIDNQDQIHCDLLNLLKQNLWMIGQIGSGKYGIQLLDPMYNINLKSSVIELVLDNFSHCPLWEIRGLCFYVIGLFSTTVEGIEILDEFGWYVVLDQYGQSKGLAYPKSRSDIITTTTKKNQDRANLFNLEIVNPYRDFQYYLIFSSLVEKTIEDSLPPLQLKVIQNLQNLNAILSKIEYKSVRDLSRLKIQEQASEIFNDVDLFLEVVRLIDKGNFSFHKRAFIFRLFTKDTRVLEDVLKKERGGSFRIQN